MSAESEREPRPPMPGELCNECRRPATWAFTVKGIHPRSLGRTVKCDQHGAFYLKQGSLIYPVAHR